MKTHKDLIAWQKSLAFVTGIYEITRSYPKDEMYGLINQLRRAAVSVPSNIAEGHIRQHRTEFRQFLSVALGSLAELETQVVISRELNYISTEKSQNLIEQMGSPGKMTRGLIKKLTNP